MKSKPFVLSLVLGVGVVALWLAFVSVKRPDVGQPSSPVVPPAPSVATQDPGAPSIAPGNSPLAETPPVASRGADRSQVATSGSTLAVAKSDLPPERRAQVDVTRVRHMVADFHTLTGENPVGTNADIMKQMMGGNSHQATLGPPEGLPLNAQGELLDQWGTPYFFHQLSRDKMEVRSAGPDKVMWTADDVIAR